MKKAIKWFRKNYNRIVNSIAFYPALIALGFLMLSIIMISLDFSARGRQFKANIKWISLKDANTARTMISVIAAGILSLTVFSFSMVMIVLNQAASNMSNRILESMIRNRFQQYILGIYIGTIVYALMLLSTIRDIDSGTSVPALSTYLLVLFTVADIFLFIYFLHFVTQTVKFETIIHKIHVQTKHALKKGEPAENMPANFKGAEVAEVRTPESGYFQRFDRKQILEFATKNDVFIEFAFRKGKFIIKDNVLMRVYGNVKLTQSKLQELLLTVDFYNGQPIDINPYYGFKHLMEVCLKALSPGINDPATAVLGLHALADLLTYCYHHPFQELIKDDDKKVRIKTVELRFDELLDQFIFPVWHYGKKDPLIQRTMQELIFQFGNSGIRENQFRLLKLIKEEINAQVL